MEKVVIKRKRPKAFIGAIIGAVGSIASGVIGGIQAKKQAKAEAAAQELANKKEEAANLTQAYANDAQRNEEFQNKFKTKYKTGGGIYIKPSKRGTFTAAATKHGQSVQGFASKVLANKGNYSPAMVKKANFARNAAKWKHELGGSESSSLTSKRLDTASNTIVQNRSKVARKPLESLDENLEDDRTSYAKGGKPKCAKGGVEPIITEGGDGIGVGSSLTLLRGRKHRTGGIIIGKGQNSIEAESGEVVKREKNQMKIFSAEPILNGKSPAKKVLENPSKANQVFQEQESYKERNNLNNDGSKKAKLGLKKGLDIGADIAGAAAPLISGIISKKAIGKTKVPPKPAEYIPAKLKTSYNISPQLAELERTKEQITSDIDSNTVSSAAALARKQRIRTDIGTQKNLLFGQKENIETEMLNRDAINRQQIASQNIAQSNEYVARKNQFETEKRLAKADVTNQMIEGSVSGIRDWQARRDRQKQEKSALAAIMAGNPEQVDLFMKKKKQYETYLGSDTFGCGGKKKLRKK